jgi:hypothetical protein
MTNDPVLIAYSAGQSGIVSVSRIHLCAWNLGCDDDEPKRTSDGARSRRSQERFAMRAARELSESSDAVMVGVAGQIIGQYGVILSALDRGTNRFTVDYAPLAEALLTRAQVLKPGDPHWQQQLELLRKLRPSLGAPQ